VGLGLEGLVVVAGMGRSSLRRHDTEPSRANRVRTASLEVVVIVVA